ncbi:MAG: hypothetical protein IKT05_05145 [Fibrobacter sp.]|nr:hypothetical protein [Fibrobacter sp.]
MKKLLVFAAMMVSFAFAKSEPFTHDGFYFSVTSGLGYGTFYDDIEDGLASLETNGIQGEASIRIGGAIVNGLILNAVLSMNQIYPSLDFTSKVAEDRTLEHDGFNILMFGGGATFYIPGNTNIFLAAAAGVTTYSVNFGNQSADFMNLDSGFGANFMIGKEWWIHEELGLGIAFSYTYTSAEGEYMGEKNEATTNMFSLSATFTFN